MSEKQSNGGFVILELSVKVSSNAWTDFSDENDFKDERCVSSKRHFDAASPDHFGWVLGCEAARNFLEFLDDAPGGRKVFLAFSEAVAHVIDEKVRELDAANRPADSD